MSRLSLAAQLRAAKAGTVFWTDHHEKAAQTIVLRTERLRIATEVFYATNSSLKAERIVKITVLSAAAPKKTPGKTGKATCPICQKKGHYAKTCPVRRIIDAAAERATPPAG